MKRITVIDDDKDICRLLQRFLTKNGFEAEVFQSGAEALAYIKKNPQDVILCDYKLPDITGVELLQKIKVLNPDSAVIIITGYSDVRVAVEALRFGAFDYVVKPLYPDEILHTIETSLKANTDKKRTAERPSQVPVKYVTGISPQSKNIENLIELIAPTEMSVIITGETGTGKEFVANSIHKKSDRSSKPFIAIDCGAIPKDLAGSELFGHVKGAFTGALQDKTGSFEMANGGTLFLDEIGNLSYENQVKLLRVLQERSIKKIGSNKNVSIDVRLIVATNENLKNAIDSGEFREDIFHRLNEFEIHLSPLRDRKDDILIYADHFLSESNLALKKEVQAFSDEAASVLQSYPWYGNLRELRNVVKRAVLLCQDVIIEPKHFPAEILRTETTETMRTTSNNDLKEAAGMAEKTLIIEMLGKVNYNKSKAAKLLNIDRKTLYNKLRIYNIKL